MATARGAVNYMPYHRLKEAENRKKLIYSNDSFGGVYLGFGRGCALPQHGTHPRFKKNGNREVSSSPNRFGARRREKSFVRLRKRNWTNGELP